MHRCICFVGVFWVFDGGESRGCSHQHRSETPVMPGRAVTGAGASNRQIILPSNAYTVIVIHDMRSLRVFEVGGMQR